MDDFLGTSIQYSERQLKLLEKEHAEQQEKIVQDLISSGFLDSDYESDCSTDYESEDNSTSSSSLQSTTEQTSPQLSLVSVPSQIERTDFNLTQVMMKLRQIAILFMLFFAMPNMLNESSTNEFGNVEYEFDSCMCVKRDLLQPLLLSSEEEERSNVEENDAYNYKLGIFTTIYDPINQYKVVLHREITLKLDRMPQFVVFYPEMISRFVVKEADPDMLSRRTLEKISTIILAFFGLSFAAVNWQRYNREFNELLAIS